MVPSSRPYESHFQSLQTASGYFIILLVRSSNCQFTRVLFDNLIMMLWPLHNTSINTSPLNWPRARGESGIIWQSTLTHRTTLTVLKGRGRLRWHSARLPSMSPWAEYSVMAGVTETENLHLVLAFLSRAMQRGYTTDVRSKHPQWQINKHHFQCCQKYFLMTRSKLSIPPLCQGWFCSFLE